MTYEPESKRLARYSGFFEGISGITYFLLRYYEQCPDDQVLQSALKSLQWLKKCSRKNRQGYYWYVNDRKKVYDRWLNIGSAGIALTFTTAHQIMGDQEYKKLAEGALNTYPDYLVPTNFSLANGLVGLGEVYLTASEVFQNEQWQERACFIKDIVHHTSRGKNDSRYWIMENNTTSAGFMVGNAGILHFLARYDSPEDTEFPI